MHSSGPPWRVPKMLSMGSESLVFNDSCYLWSCHGTRRIAPKKLSSLQNSSSNVNPSGSPPGIWLATCAKVQAWAKSPDLTLDYVNSRSSSSEKTQKTRNASKKQEKSLPCLDDNDDHDFLECNGSINDTQVHVVRHQLTNDHHRVVNNLQFQRNADPHHDDFSECSTSDCGIGDQDAFVKAYVSEKQSYEWQSDPMDHMMRVTTNGSANSISPGVNGSEVYGERINGKDLLLENEFVQYPSTNGFVQYPLTHSDGHVTSSSRSSLYSIKVERKSNVVSASKALPHDSIDSNICYSTSKDRQSVVNIPSPSKQRSVENAAWIEKQTIINKNECVIEHPPDNPLIENQVQNQITEKEKDSKQISQLQKVPQLSSPIRMPEYRLPASDPSARLKETILFLESLGSDFSRLIRDDPTVLKCDAKSLRNMVCTLEYLGVKLEDLGRIFNLCPKILHLDPETDLKNITTFLFYEVGLAPKDFSKVIRRCPRLLVADIDELRKTLKFLRTLGFTNMGQVVSNNATLISFSVEKKLVPKLRYLERLGFAYREAVSMVIRFPAIFNYSAQDNLQPKHDYLIHEMGRRNRDLLAFPQYFGYSLEKRIKPRHQCMAKQGVSLSLQAMLKLSETEFNAKFKCSDIAECFPRDSFEIPQGGDVQFSNGSNPSLAQLSFNHLGAPVLVGAHTC